MANAWLILLIAFIAGVCVFSHSPVRRLIRACAKLTHLAEHRRIALPLAFIIAAFLGAIPWLLGNIAPPSFHDEFAYLLGADTFAHGRLTNPTPAFAEHFETFHEIVHPTYQSKFPPGQSIALFIGQMLGAPIIGAFGSVAVASAAAYWMLRAVLPARWAIAGALLTAIHPLIFVWSQMYWGGGVPLIGSMLLVGGVLRIARCLRKPTSHAQPCIASISIGVAIGIFLNTRLLEGGITCAVVFLWLFARAIRFSSARVLVKPVLVAFATLVPILAWMGYYNSRVTGHALQLPYLLHTQQYMRSPLFTWEGELPPKTYADERMRRFHEEYEVEEWRKVKQNFWQEAGRKLGEYYEAFGGMLLLPLLPVLPRLLRRSWIARLCLLIAVAFPVLQIAISVYFRPHYTAPMMGAVILLIVLLLREWTRVRLRNLRIGQAVAYTALMMFIVFAATSVWNDYGNENRLGSTRQKMIDRLENTAAQHLILVNYTPRPQQLFEWVYNSANIDSQPVIWARSLGEAKDRDLLAHYKHRRQWLLTVDFNTLSPLQRLN